jgi:hypothetical protein
MQVPRWEYRRLLLKANTVPDEQAQDWATFFYFGRATLDSPDWKDDEIAELGREGWEMVAAVPIIGGRVKEAPSINWGAAYVVGYSLWFKRPLAFSK